jgi:hypothetical protein
MQGLTVLYIPQEGLNLNVEEVSKDKELVKRLEGNMHPDIVITSVIYNTFVIKF